MEYRWGAPAPGYRQVNAAVLESWQHVRIENRGTEDVYNVTATIMAQPANVTIVDGGVTIGDVPAGGSAWSSDNYTLRLDMMNPSGPDEQIYWRIEYDDAAGVHHVIENVPQFPPGEGPCD